jgi:hypothetical protein
MLSVITPATSSDLTILATLKAELGITGTTQDAYLSTLIAQVSDGCARYCRRTTFGRERVAQTERISTPRDCIVLDRDLAPSIVSVVEDGTTLAAADYEIDGALLYRLESDSRIRWPVAKIVVTYDAGYTLLTDLPADLERAALDWAKALYSAQGRDPMLRSESADGVGSASYLDPRGGLLAAPPQTSSILDHYRVVSL